MQKKNMKDRLYQLSVFASARIKKKKKQKITKESLQVGSRMAENPIAEPTCLLFSPARQAMGPHFNMEHKMEGNP